MAADWALVTGASRGIGRAIALELGRLGMHVVVNYRSGADAAVATVADLVAAGGSAEAVAFDVADGPAARAAVETLLSRLGAPYVLVNNAGITRDNLMVWMTDEDWDLVVRTNLSSFFYVTKPCLKPMLVARRGRIINITSTAGQVGNAGQVNYSASKAGLIGATKALAAEVGRRGVTVNAIAPGFVETDMTSGLPADKLVSSIPVRRFGRPEEIGAAVRFLVGEDAGYVTGQVIAVNGGLV